MVKLFGMITSTLALHFERETVPFKTTLASTSLYFNKEFSQQYACMDMTVDLKKEDEEFEFPSLMALYHTAGDLGGDKTTQVHNQKAYALDTIEGVSILASLSNEVGLGKLTVLNDGGVVAISWLGSGAATPITRLMTSSGKIELITTEGLLGGSLLIEVDIFKVKTGDYRVFIENTIGEIITTITDSDGGSGATRYYGLLLENISNNLTFQSVDIRAFEQPISGVEITIGAGVVGDLSNTIADRFTPPSGITFSKKALAASVPPSGKVQLWLKVLVPPSAIKPLKVDLGRFKLEAKL